MGLVEGVLLLPAALRLVDGPAHGGGDGVRVHHHHAVGVPGGPADGLDEGSLGPEEALLVRVQDGHQGDLGQVQALPEQIDAHQHVEGAQPQVPDDLHPLDGVDVVVHIAHLDARVLEVGGQVLRHPLGQGCDQHPLAPLGALVDLPDQVVDLALHRPDLDPGVQQPGGPDHLLHDLARAGALILPRGGGDIDHLVEPLFKFLKFQRPVVKGAGEPEAVIHQGGLSGPVPVIHGPHLGQGDVALVDEEDEVFGEVVQQGVGGRAHGPPLNDPGIVLDAGAVAKLLHHLHVVHGALLQPLGLHQLALSLEEGHPLLQFLVDLLDSGVHLLLGGDIVGGRPDGDVVQPADGGAGDHVDLADAVDLVPEKLHPQGGVLPIGGPDLHRVPPDPEHVAVKGDIVAFIADGHQLFQQLVPLQDGPHPQGDHHLGEVLRLAQTVDTGDGGDHDHVPPLHQGGGGGQPQPVDLLVDGGILFNEGVCVGDIGLRLVVVVVGDEVLHRVVGKELPELGTQLGGQGLVVGQHKGGPLDLFDDLGHGEGLARAGDAQQRLLVQPHLQSAGEGLDGLRLIPAGGVF